MKINSLLAILALLHFALSSSAHAQGRPGGPRGQRPADAQRPAGAPGDATAAVAHLTEAFAKVTPFDANKDGQLDGTERRALGQAMQDGTVQAPSHRTPPEGLEPPHPGFIIHRIAGMYATVAPYDANHDGVLDATEQAALKADIESGKLGRPGGPRRQRPPG